MIKYHEGGNEWPLEFCNVKEAWSLPLPEHGRGKAKGEGIIILHPDTGYTNHPELLKGGRYLTSYPQARNFFGRFSKLYTAEDTMDGTHPSHGTTTASLMFSDEGHPTFNPPNSDYPAYTVPANFFVTGIAPKAKVLPYRVTNNVLLKTLTSQKGYLKNYEENTYVTLARALYYALSRKNNQIGVVSISLGGIRSPTVLSEALAKCRKEGLIVCAAAGQFFKSYGFKNPVFPGSSPHTICSAGCKRDYSRPEIGFYGNEVDITVPSWGMILARTVGDASTSENPNPVRRYGIDSDASGTSYAAALTAGACALWLAFHNRTRLIETYGKPFLFDVFRHCLIESCDNRDGTWPRDRGFGVLHVEALLSHPLPTVAAAENLARNNNWTESNWGDSQNWGRL